MRRLAALAARRWKTAFQPSHQFRTPVEGARPNKERVAYYVDRSLMLVTALAPVIGYDKASRIAHHALEKDLTLRAAALDLGFVSVAEFDRIVDPKEMTSPYARRGECGS